jgi:AcrR family transcriptional regulator
VRTTSERAQRAIAEAISLQFREHGYGLASLKEIWAQVGITGEAALHHFGSETRLLEAFVDASRCALTQLLTTRPLRSTTSSNCPATIADFSQFGLTTPAQVAAP